MTQTATETESTLSLAAKAAGLKQTQKGLFGLGKGKADWQIECSPTGGFMLTRPWDGADDCLMSAHATWRGPVKLKRDGGKVVQSIELFLGSQLTAGQNWALDDDEQQLVQDLLTGILTRVPQWLDGSEEIDGWQPPSAKMLCEWLNAAGLEAAIDKDDNLRLALKRRGCDGQIRVEGDEGRLRFTMKLGEWRDLDETVERAMLELADEVNSHSRLVRIAWRTGENDSRQCEAQVDLSGLPNNEPLDGPAETMWTEMVRAAIDGLELALRRLGLELNGLAEPANRELAEAFGCDW